jgi:5,10-methylenetetrahydrofolate reductase
LLHVCGRDRNFLGLVAHLLGAHALGVKNLVIITGDPPKMGDFPFATPVYDVDSIGLLRLAAGLNAGIDPGRQAPRRSDLVRARHRRRARRARLRSRAARASRRRSAPAPSW